MTGYITVSVNHDHVRVPLPGLVRRLTGSWREHWQRTDALGVWCATRALPGGVTEVELELSNASVVVGQPAHGAVEVHVAVDYGGLVVVGPRSYREPEFLPNTFVVPARRAWSTRFYLAATPRVLPALRARADWRLEYGPARLPMPGPTHAELPRDRASELRRAERSAAPSLLGAPTVTPFANDDLEDGLCPKLLYLDGQMRPFGPGPLPPFYPWGPLAPDAPGGSGVGFGWWREEPEYLLAAHLHVMDRARLYYRAADGCPLSVDDYLEANLESPDYDGSGSAEPNGELPEFRGRVVGDYLPAPFDWAHFVRQVRHAVAAHAQYPTPLVARHLLALAQGARLAFSEFGPVVDGPGYTATNLATYLQRARMRPHQGVEGTFLGRQAGWVAWTVAAALRVGVAPADAGLRRWAADFLELCETAAMPSGFVQRHHYDGVDAARHGAWHSPGCDGAQVFEFSILAHGACALARALGRGAPGWVLRGAEQLSRLPVLPYGDQASFPHFVDVAVAGGAPLPELRPAATPGQDADPACGHYEALCALLYWTTLDHRWLERACVRGHAVAPGDLEAKARLLAETEDQIWSCGLAGVLARLP